MPWVYCVGKCQRGYSIYEYTARAGISLTEFLKQDFNFREAPPNEVQKMEWPKSFVPLYYQDAKPGLDYLKSRAIDPDDNMYYDTWRNGIVFPYFFDNIFCGAQIRLIEPWIDEDGEERKIDTMPGTRLGLLFYNWNQQTFTTNVRGVIITEGAFNAIAIQQALNHVYGGVIQNPWKAIACSGSGVSQHHADELKRLKDLGIKVVGAPDSDKAGLKMLRKLVNNNAITHAVLTKDDRIDWNDAAKAMGKEKFAQWLLRNIKRVNSQEKSNGSDRKEETQQ